MNINEIYIQIAETENDSSLVELAKGEVMVIPVLINLMIDNADCRAENVLIELSEQTRCCCIRTLIILLKRLTGTTILYLGIYGK